MGRTRKGDAASPGRRLTRRDALQRILASGSLALAASRASAGDGSTIGVHSARPRAAELPLLGDFAADAATSRRDRLPLLLFFDRDDCPYCERALREYLVPFSRDEWKGRALFRQVEIDRTLPVRDLDGTVTTHRALAARYGVALSPTVLIVDASGKPLAKPIVGLLTVDFYGAYVDNALADASAKLRA